MIDARISRSVGINLSLIICSCESLRTRLKETVFLRMRSKTALNGVSRRFERNAFNVS